jgi:ribose transport system permease protein
MTIESARASNLTGFLQRIRRALGRDPAVIIVYLLLFGLMLLVFVRADSFRTSESLLSVVKQSTFLSIVSIGEFAVILIGGIDLSIGSVAKLSALLTASVMAGSNANIISAVLLAVGIGVGVGAINSFVIIKLRVAPFVATFAMYYALRGLAFTYSTQPVGETSPALSTFYNQKWLGIDAIDILLGCLWLVTAVFFNRSIGARRLYALGGNEDATRLAGVRVGRLRVATYISCSVLASLAGLFEVMRAGVGDTTIGDGLELSAITAVILGGVSLFGGRGRIVGVLGGVLILQMIHTTFDYLQLNSLYQQLVEGLVILGAVAIYRRKGTTQ